MTKLTDMQLVLLSTAAAREDGSLLPPAETLGKRMDRIRRSVQALLTNGLVQEFVVTEQVRSWRHEDGTFYGVMISDAGRAALDGGADASPTSPPANGGDGGAANVDPARPVTAAPTASGATAPRADTKAAKVIEMLRRDDGASIAEIMEHTGWLAHTTRAALTGLRKKGHAIDKTSVEGVTRYSIKAAV